ncbi:hypothetical protein GCM10008179_19680 [Hansschlegelia plantiphila]|uniref:Uncharacterized protein n=1 Tax=Hansschlegelia plantiphila TaxID=374655 RepID=A0A9W6J2Y3_9HYPH|nr:hypothetical protein GCM10008179_19680 [Hansschlegelia plantiphila]
MLFRERIGSATTQPAPFDGVPDLLAEVKDPRLGAMLPDIQRLCRQPQKRSEACRGEQTSAAREYLDIKDNIIADTVKSTMMTECLERFGKKSGADWRQVVSCFKSDMDAHNRAALLAEEEQARKAAEQRRLDEARRAEEQKKAQEEAEHQAEARRIEQEKRAEEERAAKAKLDAEVAEIEKPQDCVEPSSSELETIRDNFEIDLYDARSARFHSACKYTKPDHRDRSFVCGLVNSKNAMGAYVGYHPFYAEIETAQIKDIVADEGTGDETKRLIKQFQLTSHCEYCTTANRSYEACREAVKSGKYDPLEEARSRRQ